MNREAHCGFLSCRLVAHAARIAPGDLKMRLEEEWLAALNDCQGPAARLRFVIGCWWAAAVIRHEHADVAARAVTAPTVTGTTTGPFEWVPRLMPRRAAVLLAIVSLHVLAIGILVAEFAWPEVPSHEAETTIYLSFAHSPLQPSLGSSAWGVRFPSGGVRAAKGVPGETPRPQRNA